MCCHSVDCKLVVCFVHLAPVLVFISSVIQLIDSNLTKWGVLL